MGSEYTLLGSFVDPMELEIFRNQGLLRSGSEVLESKTIILRKPTEKSYGELTGFNFDFGNKRFTRNFTKLLKPGTEAKFIGGHTEETSQAKFYTGENLLVLDGVKYLFFQDEHGVCYLPKGFKSFLDLWESMEGWERAMSTLRRDLTGLVDFGRLKQDEVGIESMKRGTYLFNRSE